MAIQIASFWRLHCRHGQHAKSGFVARTWRGSAIDYTREKIAKLRPKFDLVLDGVGESVWAESFRVLKVGGRLLTLTPPIPEQPSGRLRFFVTASREWGSALRADCWAANAWL